MKLSWTWKIFLVISTDFKTANKKQQTSTAPCLWFEFAKLIKRIIWLSHGWGVSPFHLIHCPMQNAYPVTFTEYHHSIIITPFISARTLESCAITVNTTVYVRPLQVTPIHIYVLYSRKSRYDIYQLLKAVQAFWGVKMKIGAKMTSIFYLSTI